MFAFLLLLFSLLSALAFSVLSQETDWKERLEIELRILCGVGRKTFNLLLSMFFCMSLFKFYGELLVVLFSKYQ